MRKRLFIASILFIIYNVALGQLVDTVFTMANTLDAASNPIFKTNSFRCIGVGKDGHVWVGTSQQGLYKFNGEKWEQFGGLQNNLINDIKPDKLGSIWVAQSGYNGAQAITGGVYYFPSGKSFNNSVYYPPSKGLPTRYARSLYIDTTRYVYGSANGLATPTMPIWVACMGQITGGVSATGAIGRGLQIPEGIKKDFDSIKRGVDVSNNLGSVQVIGGDLNEVWAFAQNNFGRNQILVYKYANGQFKYALDYTTNPLIFTQYFIARAIYFDAKGRKWIGLSSGEVIVSDATGWHKVSLPTSSLTSVNTNAITGDKAGNIYIGTTDGLVVYNNAGPINQTSSYKRYSILDDLPSSNVTGIAIDHRNLTVWLATTAGIARLGSPLTVYNLVHFQANNTKVHEALKKVESGDSSEIRSLVQKADKYRTVRAYKKTVQVDDKPIDINIAADSSISTLIVYTGDDPQKKEIKINTSIAGVPISNVNYTTTFGRLIEITRNSDSLVYLYHHPTFVYLGENAKSVAYDFVLKDKESAATFYEGKLKIFHSPVLFVHGVWSSIQAFKNMLEYFATSSNNYSSHQLLGWWYPDPNHSEPGKDKTIIEYQNSIPRGIDKLLQQARENTLSAGKVNIVGHSRGGLLSRVYLQSNNTPYRNDVKSLITVNTPHRGSQGGNLVTDNRIIAFSPLGTAYRVSDVMRGLMLESFDDVNGAFDLKVNSDFIQKEVNDPVKMERNKVPVHAITSTYEFGLSRADLLKTFVIKNGKKIPYAGNLLLALRFYALLLGTRCVDGPIDECLKEIFDGETNDVVVPISSQRGGLDGKYVSYIGNKVGHSKKEVDFIINLVNVPSVLDVASTQSKLVGLLRQDPYELQSDFLVNGFKPPSAFLKYTFLPNVAGNPDGRVVRTNSTLSIDQSIRGANFTYDQIAEVPVSGSTDITAILIAYSSPSLKEVSSDVTESKAATFFYPIPKEATGKITITAYGFNSTGLVAIDTSHIKIDIPTTAKLDSIRFVRNQSNRFEVAANDSISFSVLGYYSDTVRNITHLPGLTYSFSNGGIATVMLPNYVKGVAQLGLDLLDVSFEGKTDTIEVEVTDSIASAAVITPLPVSLLSFTGEYKDNTVNLSWTTTEEINNKHFEIEYSHDGNTFKKIGTIPGKGNSSYINKYSFRTNHHKEGRNYYRLKQVDIDEKYKHSSVVAITIKQLNALSLYPNPTRHQVTLSASQPLKNCRIQLANVLGQTVLTMGLNHNSSSQVISLNKLTKGLYIFTVINEAGEVLIREKLVIN